MRPKTAAEVAFCALGPVAEAFIKGAAARGVTTLAADLVELCAMEAAHGKTSSSPPSNGRSASAASGPTTCVPSWRPEPVSHGHVPGDALIVDLPVVATRSLGDYAIGVDQ